MTEDMSNLKIATSSVVLEPLVVKLLDRIEQLGYEAFQEVIALGRWPDGTKLSAVDTSQALQALLVYEHRHVPLEKRSGFIVQGQCKS